MRSLPVTWYLPPVTFQTKYGIWETLTLLTFADTSSSKSYKVLLKNSIFLIVVQGSVINGATQSNFDYVEHCLVTTVSSQCHCSPLFDKL